MSAGLVLAAGAGRRFGAEPKLLADLGGRPVLDHAVASARAALDRVVVVLGAHAEEVRAACDLDGVEVVVCAGWEEGQSASLRCGLAALAGEERIVVLLGDQPLVPPEVIRRMAREPPGSRAAHGGVPGHPVVLDRELAARAAGLDGDHGLRDLVAWRLVEAEQDIIRDVDTPADLEAIRP